MRVNIQVGEKVHVPSYNQNVVVTKVENGIPTEGKFIDGTGKLQIVDLVTTTWELYSVVKALWNIIRTLFKG
jgi:hypothetical protein